MVKAGSSGRAVKVGSRLLEEVEDVVEAYGVELVREARSEGDYEWFSIGRFLGSMAMGRTD